MHHDKYGGYNKRTTMMMKWEKVVKKQSTNIKQPHLQRHGHGHSQPRLRLGRMSSEYTPDFTSYTYTSTSTSIKLRHVVQRLDEHIIVHPAVVVCTRSAHRVGCQSLGRPEWILVFVIDANRDRWDRVRRGLLIRVVRVGSRRVGSRVVRGILVLVLGRGLVLVLVKGDRQRKIVRRGNMFRLNHIGTTRMCHLGCRRVRSGKELVIVVVAVGALVGIRRIDL